MLSAGLSGGLGFAFWAFAAHHHDASAVGAISAEVSSITFLAGVGSLNLISIFGRFLPVAGWRARKLIATGYGSACLAGLLFSMVFLFTPLAKGLIIGGEAGSLAFVVCVIVNSVFNIQDGGLIGFGRFGWIPVENSSVALLRFLLLPVTAIFLAARVGVLWAWALPMIIAVAVVNIFNLGPLASQKMRQRPNLPKIGEMSKLVAVGSLSNSVNATVTAFLPALVTHRLGSVQGGYFYVPWTITAMVLLLLNNVTTSMVREVIANPKRAGQAIRRSVMLAALVGVVVMVTCLFFARLILAPLGPGFAVHGAPLLRWAGLAMPATAAIVLFWAVCSIRRRPLPSFAVNLLTATAIVGGVLLLRPGADISRVGMIYCTVQWAAAAVLAVPTFTALRSIARDGESRRQLHGSFREHGSYSGLGLPTRIAAGLVGLSCRSSPRAAHASSRVGGCVVTAVRAPTAVRPTAWQPVADDSRVVATAWSGIGASILAALLILFGAGHWPALLGALLAATVPVGAAVMCWLDSGDGFAQAGLTLVVSLAATAIFSAVLIWSAAWHPVALFAVFLIAGAGSCIARLVMRGGAWQWRPSKMPEQALARVASLIIGVGAWALGVSLIRPAGIGFFGLLGSANVWFILGVVVLLVGGLLELSRPRPSTWLVTAYLAALIVAIHATVPFLYSVPEYPWVFKHVGIIQSLNYYGHTTDPSNIYQQWPAFFAAVASISNVANVSPLAFAAWGPVFFELADALLLLGALRLVAPTRRVAYVALFLYAGLVAWVGQDYLSPQAFGYLLWLGIVIILARWLLASVPGHSPNRMLSLVRAPFIARQLTPYHSTRAQQKAAAALIAVIFFAIVAAHQLTPYMAIVGVAALVLIGMVRRGWQLVLLLVLIAFGFLGPRYGLISQQFGGLFSGGNPLNNASGVKVAHQGAEAVTADIVRVLGVGMWLATLVVIAFQRRVLGTVSIAIALAFSPFLILGAQSYGGEAIYRVYLFSAPWCALLIADALVKVRAIIWYRTAVIGACSLALAGGLQGLYGPVASDTFTPAELSASLWLYGHAAPDSAIVLPVDNTPILESANYSSYPLYVMTRAYGVDGKPLNEGSVVGVESWLDSLKDHYAYVVFSRSMNAFASYYTTAPGYAQLASAVRDRYGWTAVYRNADTTIYQFLIVPPGSLPDTRSDGGRAQLAEGSCHPTCTTLRPHEAAKSAHAK